MDIIPVFEYPSYSESVVLENKPYRFSFVWNSRGEYWSLTISDKQGEVLLDGLKLVLGFELISEYADEDLPPGALLVLDTTDSLTGIGRDDLGVRATLIYASSKEVQEILERS